MTVKALGFDLDDTLYSHYDYYNEIFNVMERSVIKTGIQFGKFYSVFQKFSIEEYNNYMEDKKSKVDYKNDRVIDTYSYFGISIDEPEAIIFNSLYLYFQNKIKLREGITELFCYAKSKDIKLFVLTNGPSEDQRRKLHFLELDKYIPSASWFISDELEMSKPDNQIFSYVQNSLGFKAEEIVYLGDSLENDVKGASRVGWKAVWLKNGSENMEVENSIEHISQVNKFL